MTRFGNTTIAAVLALSASLASAASPPSANAQPFGITIGATNCQQAAKILGGKVEIESETDGVVQVEAADANSMYPGAESIKAECFAADQPVVRLALTASKGGMGNPGAQEAYRALSAKYKRVAGGPIPQLGNGYARFNVEDAHLPT